MNNGLGLSKHGPKGCFNREMTTNLTNHQIYHTFKPNLRTCQKERIKYRVIY